jgi:hypothetical protein
MVQKRLELKLLHVLEVMCINGYIVKVKAIKILTVLLLENTQIDPMCYLYHRSGK